MEISTSREWPCFSWQLLFWKVNWTARERMHKFFEVLAGRRQGARFATVRAAIARSFIHQCKCSNVQMCKCEDSSLRRFVQCKLNCSLVISRWSFKWLNLFWLQKSSLVATCDSLKKKRTFLGEEWNGPEPVTDPKVIPWKSASRWFDPKSLEGIKKDVLQHLFNKPVKSLLLN